MNLGILWQKMRLDKLLHVRRPTATLLMILLGTVIKRRLMNAANKRARLGLGCGLV